MANHDIKLLAVGDVQIGGRIQKIDGSVDEPTRKDPSSAFPFVKPIFGEGNIVFCNFEGILSERGKPAFERKVAVRCSPEMVQGLSFAGFNLVNLANNHSMDYGPDAMVDTLELFNKNKIAYIGAGKDIFEARRPLVLEKEGTRIAFLGYTTDINQPTGFAANSKKPGANPIRISPLFSPPHVDEEDLETMTEDIKKAKSLADLTVVSFHWSVGSGVGGEVISLTVHQLGLTHAAVDAGADLILGHGVHVIQGIEVYKGKAICYGLGNFVVDRKAPAKDAAHDNSIILICEISGKRIRKVSLVPTFNDRGQARTLSPEDENCIRIQRHLDRVSKKLGTTLSFEGATGVVNV